MRLVHVSEAPIGPSDEGLPRSAPWREHLLDAVVLACALVARGGKVPASARMALIVETRRRGLNGVPSNRDVLALLDLQMTHLTDARMARRHIARSMNRFVGTPWARTIVEVANTFAGAGAPAEPAALALVSLRVALGLPCSDDCAP